MELIDCHTNIKCITFSFINTEQKYLQLQEEITTFKNQ